MNVEIVLEWSHLFNLPCQVFLSSSSTSVPGLRRAFLARSSPKFSSFSKNMCVRLDGRFLSTGLVESPGEFAFERSPTGKLSIADSLFFRENIPPPHLFLVSTDMVLIDFFGISNSAGELRPLFGWLLVPPSCTLERPQGASWVLASFGSCGEDDSCGSTTAALPSPPALNSSNLSVGELRPAPAVLRDSAAPKMADNSALELVETDPPRGAGCTLLAIVQLVVAVCRTNLPWVARFFRYLQWSCRKRRRYSRACLDKFAGLPSPPPPTPQKNGTFLG